ncbi:MAG: aminotransferase class I/II-fold pyridoxal phosphate-dependent enzyme [Chloroflexi bacterium]|nr:aminotransferase class I/II-fold pyridoxal phosphate-dependent enzyme [Chloroflexota bacterium]
MIQMAHRVHGLGTTIFQEMSVLARQHNAVDLGQGYPNFAAPDFIKQAAIAAINNDINQYAPSNGRASLRHALAAKVQRQYGLEIDPDSQINVVVGATEAIFAVVLGLVNPGDEVIVIEPFYDSYVPAIQFAGGIPRYYTLRQPDWAIDADELAALFNDKTKLIILNTPHNPTGKVFTLAELTLIANLCQAHNVIAMSDEVYEHIVFDGRQHIPLITLPSMAERTVMVSSLGKTFSVTGWKVGWAIATPNLSTAVFRAHQFMTYCGAAPLQEAAATAMAMPDEYFAQLAQDYQTKRNFLMEILQTAGLTPIQPTGTYFVMADISHLGFADDVAFCRHLTTEVGVTAIPPSSFYHNPADGAGLARFAFCKSQAILEEAAVRLQKL